MALRDLIHNKKFWELSPAERMAIFARSVTQNEKWSKLAPEVQQAISDYIELGGPESWTPAGGPVDKPWYDNQVLRTVEPGLESLGRSQAFATARIPQELVAEPIAFGERLAGSEIPVAHQLRQLAELAASKVAGPALEMGPVPEPMSGQGIAEQFMGMPVGLLPMFAQVGGASKVAKAVSTAAKLGKTGTNIAQLLANIAGFAGPQFVRAAGEGKPYAEAAKEALPSAATGAAFGGLQLSNLPYLGKILAAGPIMGAETAVRGGSPAEAALSTLQGMLLEAGLGYGNRRPLGAAAEGEVKPTGPTTVDVLTERRLRNQMRAEGMSDAEIDQAITTGGLRLPQADERAIPAEPLPWRPRFQIGQPFQLEGLEAMPWSGGGEPPAEPPAGGIPPRGPSPMPPAPSAPEPLQNLQDIASQRIAATAQSVRKAKLAKAARDAAENEQGKLVADQQQEQANAELVDAEAEAAAENAALTKAKAAQTKVEAARARIARKKLESATPGAAAAVPVAPPAPPSVPPTPAPSVPRARAQARGREIAPAATPTTPETIAPASEPLNASPLTDLQKAILKIVQTGKTKNEKGMTPGSLTHRTAAKPSEVMAALKVLEDQGLVTKTGKGTANSKVYYQPTGNIVNEVPATVEPIPTKKTAAAKVAKVEAPKLEEPTGRALSEDQIRFQIEKAFEDNPEGLSFKELLDSFEGDIENPELVGDILKQYKDQGLVKRSGAKWVSVKTEAPEAIVENTAKRTAEAGPKEEAAWLTRTEPTGIRQEKTPPPSYVRHSLERPSLTLGPERPPEMPTYVEPSPVPPKSKETAPYANVEKGETGKTTADYAPGEKVIIKGEPVGKKGLPIEYEVVSAEDYRRLRVRGVRTGVERVVNIASVDEVPGKTAEPTRTTGETPKRGRTPLRFVKETGKDYYSRWLGQDPNNPQNSIIEDGETHTKKSVPWDGHSRPIRYDDLVKIEQQARKVRIKFLPETEEAAGNQKNWWRLKHFVEPSERPNEKIYAFTDEIGGDNKPETFSERDWKETWKTQYADRSVQEGKDVPDEMDLNIMAAERWRYLVNDDVVTPVGESNATPRAKIASREPNVTTVPPLEGTRVASPEGEKKPAPIKVQDEWYFRKRKKAAEEAPTEEPPPPTKTGGARALLRLRKALPQLNFTARLLPTDDNAIEVTFKNGKKVTFRDVDKIEGSEERLAAETSATGGKAGTTEFSGRTAAINGDILVDLLKDSNTADARHELVHVARRLGLISDGEFSTLYSAFKKEYKTAKPSDLAKEEAIAYGLEGKSAYKRTIWQRVERRVQELANWLKETGKAAGIDLGKPTPLLDEIVAKYRTGEAFNTEPTQGGAEAQPAARPFPGMESPETTGAEAVTYRVRPKEVAERFYDEDIAPMARGLTGGVAETFRGLRNLVFPTQGVKPADMDTVMKMLGKRTKVQFQLDSAIATMDKKISKMPEDEQRRILNDVETGRLDDKDPEIAEFKKFARSWQDALFREIQKYKDSFEATYPDYVRHFWKVLPGTEGEGERYSGPLGRRPLTGGEPWARARQYDTYAAGEADGGVPWSLNVAKILRRHTQQVMQFVTAKELFEQFKDSGGIKLVRKGRRAPAGFEKVGDPLFRLAGKNVEYGDWYAEPNVARVLNNLLSRDYIRESKVGSFLMDMKHLTTGIELGFSMFHAMFEGQEVVSSQLGTGLRKILNLGDVSGGLKDITTALAAPYTKARLGGTLKRAISNPETFKRTPEWEWLKKRFPNIDLNKFADDLFSAGGKFEIDEGLRTNWRSSMMDAVHKGNFAGAAWRAPLAGMEKFTSFLFEDWIPKWKVGMFASEYALSLAENAKDIASGRTSEAQVARKTWAFIEDRMGELNYDTLMWNRTFKTAMQATFRSVTWKLGNLRAFFGVLPELKDAALKIKAGERPQIPPKLAWIMSMTAMMATMGTVIQTFATGKKPETFKDMMFPQVDPDDNTVRLSIPTYWKDVLHLADSPWKYTRSSMSGILSRMLEDFSNEDFYGTQIYSRTDPIYEKVAKSLTHLAPVPISFQSFGRLMEEGHPVFAAASFGGFTKAPRYIVQSKAEELMTEMLRSKLGREGRPASETEKGRARSLAEASIRAGYPAEKPPQLSVAEWNRTLRDAQLDPFVERFKRLKLTEAVEVWNAMDDTEKKTARYHLLMKLRNRATMGVSSEELQNINAASRDVLRLQDVRYD